MAAQEQARAERERAAETAISEKQLLAMLVEDLHPLAANWKSLGTQLNIKRAQLRNIAGEDSRVANCFEAIIDEWFTSVDPPHTKERLVKVLESEALREKRLANEIKKDEEIPDNFDEDEDAAIPLLIRKLNSIAHRYSTFGLQLGVDEDRMKGIEYRVVNVSQYLSDTLSEWKKNGNGNLTEILDAIRSPTINNKRLANDLEKKWKEKGLLKEEATDIN